MSERKVLTKYFPPDFDPSKIQRTRGPKNAGPKVQTVRLMAPFSMKCTACGEYIYKGRKFNARKETTDEKYLAISIFRFYIRCTRCSAEITFKTDPRRMDYECERGAKRNFEVWRSDGNSSKVETDEERLDRLEAEEAEVDAMGQLETKMVDAKREMQIADALDEIRTRNARNERVVKEGEVEVVREGKSEEELERERVEREDEEAVRIAFGRVVRVAVEKEGEGQAQEKAIKKKKNEVEGLGEVIETVLEEAIELPAEEEVAVVKKKASSAPSRAESDAAEMPPPPTFKRGTKRKKDFGAALGIKKKPALV